MSLRLRVRDVLGVVSADVPLDGLLLVGGINGAGKSSLLNSAAAAALRLWTLRGARLKADAARVLRRGATGAGTATLEWSSGAVRVSWPAAEIDETGDASLKRFGSPYGIGAVRWMEAEPRVRMADLADRLNLTPGEAEIAAWFQQHYPERENIPGLAAAMADKVMLSGWDPVHKTAVEHGTKLKGRWEQATGQKWGSARADGWTPPGLLKGEPYSLEAADADVAQAKAALQRVIAAGAVTDAEIEAAERLSATAPDLRQKAATLQAEGSELAQTLERLQAEREQLVMVAPQDDDDLPPVHDCPHCGAGVVITNDRELKKAAPRNQHAAPTPEQVAARAGIEAAIADARAKIRATSVATSQAEASAMMAEQAEARVAQLRAAPKRDAAAIGAAQSEVARLEARRDAVKTLHSATAIFQQWRDQQPVIEALSPAGVRAAVLDQRLGVLNAELAELCGIAKWAPVVLNEAAEPTYDGLPYLLLSESERWRVDLTLQVAFAMREGAGLMLVDRLDVLAAPSRPGAIMLMKHAGIPTLIGMTAAKPEPPYLPDLAAAKVGRSAWMEAGQLRLL
jgi:hypothetical protein